jgi:hypothetical protein
MQAPSIDTNENYIADDRWLEYGKDCDGCT